MWGKCSGYAISVQIIRCAIFQTHHCEGVTDIYVTVWNCVKWR